MSDAADRIIALAHKQSEHPLRNAILFMTGWIILVAIGVVLIVVLVWPRTQGYVAMPYPGQVASANYSTSDLLYFGKLRQKGAQQLEVGDEVAVQLGKEVQYQVGTVVAKSGMGDNMKFTVDIVAPHQAKGQEITLDEIRGILLYKLPFVGKIYSWTGDAVKSFALVLVAQLLLVYAGWQIGTSMINARDPQRQARAARLRTAALAGNLETTRQRLRRQQLR